jgi:transketolase
MRLGIAADHAGFDRKEELLVKLRAAGHEVVDFGAHQKSNDDDYPDFVIPLARAVAAGTVERGVALCGSGIGASVCADKIPGVRAAEIHDNFSARQGVEDDHVNILCMGGQTVGSAVAWDLVQTFLAAKFSDAERHVRRLAKVASLEAGTAESHATAPDLGIDQLAINTIRTLAIDAIERAQSGHPGTVMDAAPTAYTLWQRFLRYDPLDPGWLNRDRFVLSCGHASMLLYALLHLAGVKAVDPRYGPLGRNAVTLRDIETFRQAGSRCPGHPEYRWTSGVECTTGPLGQGIATSVGMAIAGKWMAATYNRPDYELFDFNVYALCSDGDMMEGIASEAASLAGHLRLGNLCWIYDSNRVTIEGRTDITFTEDVTARFLAYGWNVTRVTDPNDLEPLGRAYENFLQTHDRPTLIVVHSHIGYGAPHKQDSPKAHGEPLGAEEVRLAKEFFGFSADASFVVPDGVREHFATNAGARGARLHREWDERLARYKAQYPDLAEQIELIGRRGLPEGWRKALSTFQPSPKGMSTREASGKVLNALAAEIPWLVGGAADLSPSTNTRLAFEFAGDFQAPDALGDRRGRNLHFGVREHAMCAVVNGLALTGLRAFGAGFLIFTDYARGAIRLSSLMELAVLHIWTHDSVSVGEDGPTHQPIEQLLSLRAIPGMVVIRPCDASETAEAYRCILSLENRPAALICSRQALPILDRTQYAAAGGLARGAYVLADPAAGPPAVILVGAGSEVHLCVAAAEVLALQGVAARVVSMPSWELFEEQDVAYKDSVLPPSITARVTVEEASPLGWDRYAGREGVVLGIKTFGMSAPTRIVMEHFGFSVDHVVAAAREALQKRASS